MHLTIGSFSISLFAGKVAFRDFQYVTKSYGITVVDGYMLLRYWRRNYRKRADDASSTRLQLQLNGFALHSYNRIPAYAHLSEVLRDFTCDDMSTRNMSTVSDDSHTEAQVTPAVPAWMRIFPVIRVGIRAGRWLAGNHTLPTVLSAHFRRANLVYAWEDAEWDPYVWLTAGKLTQLKVRRPSPSLSPRFDVHLLLVHSQLKANSCTAPQVKLAPNPKFNPSFGYPAYEPYMDGKKRDNIRCGDLDFSYRVAVPGMCSALRPCASLLPFFCLWTNWKQGSGRKQRGKVRGRPQRPG